MKPGGSPVITCLGVENRCLCAGGTEGLCPPWSWSRGHTELWAGLKKGQHGSEMWRVCEKKVSEKEKKSQGSCIQVYASAYLHASANNQVRTELGSARPEPRTSHGLSLWGQNHRASCQDCP